MQLTFYQVDAFASQPFEGNPAAIIVTEQALSEATMQAIAMEMNLSETAFVVPQPPNEGSADFSIRWFTPAAEVDLCGHATLAAAHTLFNHLNVSQQLIRFSSASGLLTTRLRTDSLLELDFPTNPVSPVAKPAELLKALNMDPLEVLTGGPRLVAVLANANQVAEASPDLNMLTKLTHRGICVTAAGDGRRLFRI